MTFDQLEPSAKAPWTSTMFFAMDPLVVGI